MTFSPSSSRRAVRAALGLGLFLVRLGCANDTSPVIHRVEPPSWWVAHSVNPVRLLVSGADLAGVSIAVPPGFTAANLHTSSNGTALFFDLTIPAATLPGPVPIELNRGRHTATTTLTVLPALTNHPRGFSPDDVIYLLMPDRFANGDPANDRPPQSPGLLDRAKPRHYHGGDFQGIIDRLPYLKELGVTALWLTPWYDNVNHLNLREKYTAGNQRSDKGHAVTDYHGYGAVDFYGVEEHFGSLAKLQELTAAAHANGFKMIQDQVANHTGPYHAWVKNPPTPTWFNGSAEHHLDNSWQTWTTAATNPPPDKLQSTLEGWFINLLPDLNQADPETARYLIQNSLWWIGLTGVDAVRQDTLPYVPRRYWSQWTAALKRQYPDLTVLGELFDGNVQLVSFFQGGRRQFDGVDSGVDTLFDFPLYFALREVFARGQSMTRLAEVLAADTNYVNPRGLVTFLGLHDTTRFMHETGASIEGLQLAFTFLFTTRGTPMIYYGDEIAMNGGGDPYNRADFPGGWPEDKQNAFSATGRTATQASVHAHVRKLLALRRELVPLRRGDTRVIHASEDALAYARVTGEATVLVALNNGDQSQSLRLNLPADLVAKAPWEDHLNHNAVVASTAEGNRWLTLKLPPHSAAVLVPQSSAVASDEPKTAVR